MNKMEMNRVEMEELNNKLRKDYMLSKTALIDHLKELERENEIMDKVISGDIPFVDDFIKSFPHTLFYTTLKELPKIFLIVQFFKIINP